MATLTDGTHVPAPILKKQFLERYAQIGHITRTCEDLGLLYRTLHHWKQNDPEFLKAYEEAEETALMVLEGEAFRRAVEGYDKPVYQGGVLVGYTREYSDNLLIVLLKARAPHKYKERFAGELTGANGRPLSGDVKLVHVHSNIPLGSEEQPVQRYEEIPFTEVKSTTDELDDLK